MNTVRIPTRDIFVGTAVLFSVMLSTLAAKSQVADITVEPLFSITGVYEHPAINNLYVWNSLASSGDIGEGPVTRPFIGCQVIRDNPNGRGRFFIESGLYANSIDVYTTEYGWLTVHMNEYGWTLGAGYSYGIAMASLRYQQGYLGGWYSTAEDPEGHKSAGNISESVRQIIVKTGVTWMDCVTLFAEFGYGEMVLADTQVDYSDIYQVHLADEGWDSVWGWGLSVNLASLVGRL